MKPTIVSRAVALVVGIPVVALCTWLAVRIHQHAMLPVYLIPKTGELLVAGAVIIHLVAVVVAMAMPRGWVIFLIEAALLTVFAGILLTPLGVPLLALGGVLISLEYRLISGVRHADSLAMFGLAGAASLAMTLLFMAWNHPPLVDCATGGTTATYWFWGGSPGRTSGSATTTPEGVTRGTESFGGKTYSYICRDGELVHFRRSA